MAQVTSTAAVVAGNGLGSTTHIISINTATATVAAACAEAQNEGFTVVAVEGIANGDHITTRYRYTKHYWWYTSCNFHSR